MRNKKPSSLERKKTLELLNKSGIGRMDTKKAFASPFYSSVGRGKKGILKLLD